MGDMGSASGVFWLKSSLFTQFELINECIKNIYLYQRVQHSKSAIDSNSHARMFKNNQLSYLKSQGGTVELAKKLGCENTDDGLHDNFNFARQRENFGKNFIDLPPLQSYLSLIIEGAQDVTIIMLFAAAVVSLIIGMVFEEDKSTAWIEGTAILLSISLVFSVQAGTEYSKSISFRKQQESIDNAKQCNVIRGGKTIKIHPKELVVGDVIRVALGDILQIVGVLLDGFSIKMDESALTGESKLITKVPFTDDTPIPKDAAEKDKATPTPTPIPKSEYEYSTFLSSQYLHSNFLFPFSSSFKTLSSLSRYIG